MDDFFGIANGFIEFYFKTVFFLSSYNVIWNDGSFFNNDAYFGSMSMTLSEPSNHQLISYPFRKYRNHVEDELNRFASKL